MADLAFLEYSFLFDPSDTWQSMDEFEHELTAFFAMHGKMGKLIKTLDGSRTKRIVYVTNITPLDSMRSDNTRDAGQAGLRPQANPSPKQKLNMLRSKSYYQEKK